MVKVADEVWIATALLHREHPERDCFRVREIVDRAAREKLHEPLRPGVLVHAYLHCVANKPPNPATLRILYATPGGRRRLFRNGDDVHPARAGKITPGRAEIPPKFHYLLDWYENVYSGSPRTAGGLPSLSDVEMDVQRQTLDEFHEALDLLNRVLNGYLEGFRRLGSYTLREDRDPRYLLLALVGRSFNSAWCGHGLLARGYYHQAMALARMIDEDFVTSRDVALNPDTRAALWSRTRPKRTLADIAGDICEGGRDRWDSTYGFASTIVHPRGLSLEMQFNNASGGVPQLRIGPVYDPDLAILAVDALISSARRMLNVFNGCFQLDLQAELESLRRETKLWRDRMSALLDGGRESGDEVPRPGQQ